MMQKSLKGSLEQIIQQNEPFVCRVRRKHFFNDQIYILTLNKDILIMGQKHNDTKPKYSMLLSMNIGFKWIIEQHKLIGFLFPYKGVMKQFFGLEKDMISLKCKIGSKVIFHNINDYYKPLSEIQIGNFGRVEKCICKYTNQVVAIKHLKIDGVKNHKLQAKNEAFILKSLNHPNILKLIEIYEDDFEIHLVTELIEGENLKQFLERQTTPIRQEEALNILLQTINALKTIHDANIIHRDIKPSNLMYNNNQIKIIDFGLSCFNGRQFKEFPNCGTTGYAAPEVLNFYKQKIQYDMKVDIFSVGCVLYRLLTLNGLFQSNNEEQTFRNNRDCICEIKEKGRLFDVVRILIKQNPAERPNCDQIISLINSLIQFKYFDVNFWYSQMMESNSKQCSTQLDQEQNYMTQRKQIKRQKSINIMASPRQTMTARQKTVAKL